MPVQDVIPPYEQMYLLNQQLICNADLLKHAVITVGGQAVQYWISYYHAQYGDRLPDERLTTSVDCDYSARKDDIAAIAKTLNVKTWENKDGQPPSLAQFMLIDQDTHDIKRDDGRLFAVPDAPDEQITILHASLVHRFTAGAQKEGGCRSADAIAVQIQFLLSIISGRRRKTGLATIGKQRSHVTVIA